MSTPENDYADLISQLEASKFLKLFKFVLGRVYGEGEPIALPRTEMWYQQYWPNGFLDYRSYGWLFQIAHLPYSLYQEDVVRSFFQNSLTAALHDLKSFDAIRPVLGMSYSYNPRDEQEAQKYKQFGQPSEGAIYYFFTNIDHGFIESEQAYEIAKELFKNILDLSLGWTEFSFGSPRTMLEGDPDQVKEGIVELINTPSSYYIIAREGLISVVPVTEHGLYFASHDGPKIIGEAKKGFSTSLTGKLAKSALMQEAKISELEYLINNPHPKEYDIQHFFEENPEFLFTLDERYCEICPHVCLLDRGDTQLIPDFMARIEDTNLWDLIELKLPTHSIINSREGQQKPSAMVAKGISQLIKYREFFSVGDNRRRFLSQYGTYPYEPSLVLVIGRGYQKQSYEWTNVKNFYPKVKVVPYDYLFTRARYLKNVLENYERTKDN
jgi:hypothetical protein